MKVSMLKRIILTYWDCWESKVLHVFLID